jgi:hypothetical protein
MENHSQTPNIAFSSIRLFVHDLGSHVKGRTGTGSEHLGGGFFHVFGESEIADFDNSFVNENVGWFKVSMGDIIFL